MYRRIKRRRFSRGGGVKRPIDKSIVSIDLAQASGGSTSIVLYPVGGTGVVYPCTVVGIQWDLNFSQSTAADSPTLISWAIIKLRQGVTVSAISAQNTTSFYNPEQDVVACGMMTIEENQSAAVTHKVAYQKAHGKTKAMRKLAVGDALAFVMRTDIMVGVTARSARINGIVQFFSKG